MEKEACGILPLVSIVVPVYNTPEDCMEQCVASLLNQTLDRIEVILVNDCSTESRTLAKMRELAARDHRIVLVDLPENRRQGGARNAGIKIARAPWLGFVDSDDWVDTRMYASLYEIAVGSSADIAVGGYWHYLGEGKKVLDKNGDPRMATATGVERNKAILLNGSRIVTSLFRRELFFDNDLFFPEKVIYEDNAIGAALYLCARKIVRIDAPFYYYRCDNLSTTRSKNNYHFFDRMETSKIFLQNMKRLGFYSSCKDECDICFIRLFYEATIMGALFHFNPPATAYIKQVLEEMKGLLPEFRKNCYYKRISFSHRFILRILEMNPAFGVWSISVLRKCRRIFLEVPGNK